MLDTANHNDTTFWCRTAATVACMDMTRSQISTRLARAAKGARPRLLQLDVYHANTLPQLSPILFGGLRELKLSFDQQPNLRSK